jgi:beta-1,4-mannosyltransferase
MAFPRAVYWVAVLGDFGRSPRMQYHCLSLSEKHNNDVHVIAYEGAEPLQQLREASNVTFHHIPKPSRWIEGLPRVLRLLLKAVQQLLALLWVTLVAAPHPTAILLQTPPAIPTMLVFALAARIRRARLIFDWHNFAYTLMAISLSERHWIVRLAQSYEKLFGRAADQHLCVTEAMQQELRDNWGIVATVLYDRAPDIFHPASPAEVHQLLGKLQSQGDLDASFGDQLHQLIQNSDPPATTILTTSVGVPSPQLRNDRPAVVVSSTSWTPDEDFAILLEVCT